MIEKIKIDGVEYFSFTQICKGSERLRKRVSQDVKNLPESYYYISGRGRNSKTYITKEGLFLWVNTKRSIDLNVKEKVLSILNIGDNECSSSSFEGMFIDILEGFIKDIKPNLITERQKKIDIYNVDFCIDNKIVIEFNEVSHNFKKEYDLLRSNDIKKLGYVFVVVDSHDNYGKSISKIFKELLIQNL